MYTITYFRIGWEITSRAKVGVEKYCTGKPYQLLGQLHILYFARSTRRVILEVSDTKDVYLFVGV